MDKSQITQLPPGINTSKNAQWAANAHSLTINTPYAHYLHDLRPSTPHLTTPNCILIYCFPNTPTLATTSQTAGPLATHAVGSWVLRPPPRPLCGPPAAQLYKLQASRFSITSTPTDAHIARVSMQKQRSAKPQQQQQQQGLVHKQQPQKQQQAPTTAPAAARGVSGSDRLGQIRKPGVPRQSSSSLPARCVGCGGMD